MPREPNEEMVRTVQGGLSGIPIIDARKSELCAAYKAMLEAGEVKP